MSQIKCSSDFIFKDHALWFMQVEVHQWNFEDENFVDGQFTAKTSKITSLENLYIYGILSKHNLIFLL